MTALRVFFSILVLYGSCWATNLPNQLQQGLIDDEIRDTSLQGIHIRNPPNFQYTQNVLLNNGEDQNLKTLVPFNNLHHILNPADTNELGRLLENYNCHPLCLLHYFQSMRLTNSLRVGLDNNPLVSNHLVNVINSDVINLINLQKMLSFQYIVKQTPYPVPSLGNQEFWTVSHDGVNVPTMKDRFIGENPREQQRILNKRELLRFKNIFANQALNNPLTPVISHSNFQNDDIVRAMSICGTFCSFDGFFYDPLFSGMLIPGQAYNQIEFDIHSCLHGFAGEQINQIYFVPYGLDLHDDNAFQVQRIYRDRATLNQIQQINLVGMNVYNQRDYTLAVISDTTVSGINIADVFHDRQNNNLLGINGIFPGFPVVGNLPVFIGSDVQFNNNFQHFNLNGGNGEKYTIIGRPGDRRFALNNSRFSVVTNISNDVVVNPRRSLQDDPNVIRPPILFVATTGAINGEVAIDCPNIQGMSGGICVRSFLRVQEGITQRLCRDFGVVWGAERVFDNLNNLIDLKPIISTIQ